MTAPLSHPGGWRLGLEAWCRSVRAPSEGQGLSEEASVLTGGDHLAVATKSPDQARHLPPQITLEELRERERERARPLSYSALGPQNRRGRERAECMLRPPPLMGEGRALFGHEIGHPK